MSRQEISLFLSLFCCFEGGVKGEVDIAVIIEYTG